MLNDRGHAQQPTLWMRCLLLFAPPLYLYANLFAFPAIPIHLDGDQTFFWSYALRMLHGEVIYRDFFQFTPPGTDLVFFALFRLFGARLWVANAVVLVLGVALCRMCFSLAKQLMEPAHALLAAFAVLVLGYGRILDATHHWFSLLLMLGAVRVVLPARTSSRIALAGALLGLASLFTQTAGVAGVLALLLALAWENGCENRPWPVALRRSLLLVAAFGAVFAAGEAYPLAMIGWHRLSYFQGVYPLRYVEYGHWSILPQLPAIALGRLPDLARSLFLYAVLLAVPPVVLWRCWRQRCRPSVPDAVWLALPSLLLLLEVVTRANWLRVSVAATPALLLFVRMVTRRSRRCATVAGWLIVVGLAAGQLWSRHHKPWRAIDLPAGTALVLPEKYEKLSWLAAHTRPGDLFYQAIWPGLYLPLQLRSPVYLDLLVANEETRPEFVTLTLFQLQRSQVRYILWSPVLNSPENPLRPWEDHLGPLREYLHSHYTRVQVFSDGDEVWEQNAKP